MIGSSDIERYEVIQYESYERGASCPFASIHNAILLRHLGGVNVPSLSNITEQIALFLLTTVNAGQKRTTSIFQGLLCHLRSVAEIRLLGQSWSLLAPLMAVSFELVRKSGFYYGKVKSDHQLSNRTIYRLPNAQARPTPNYLTLSRPSSPRSARN